MSAAVNPMIALALTWVSITGCSTVIDPSIGQGPISLSTQTQKAFAEYQARQTPRYFAVSTDGQAYYYSYCDAGRCLRQAKTKVIDQCERFSKGVPCKIYGSQGSIVWSDES